MKLISQSFIKYFLILIDIYLMFINSTNANFILQSKKLSSLMPTLANGHIGLTIFGDAIFMNGIYNGESGDSRRARLPNWFNLTLTSITNDKGQQLLLSAPVYALNLKDGYFRIQQTIVNTSVMNLTIEQRIYVHRYYNRALIYELLVQRNNVEEALNFHMNLKSGMPSNAIDIISSKKCDESFLLIEATTKSIENSKFQKKVQKIFIAFSEDLRLGKILHMAAGQDSLYFNYIVSIDKNATVACKELNDVLSIKNDEILHSHAIEWQYIWSNFTINIVGDNELSKTINAGIFYIMSSLPSVHTNQPLLPFYGLSPTGLGRGNLDDDYMGHNFWDTEIWMLPVVTQISLNSAASLLEYRFRNLKAAEYNAEITGYKGARFPWESGYTGCEVTNNCCPEIAAQEIHITPNIAFALQHYYVITHDREWLCDKASPTLYKIGEFLESRVDFNEHNGTYHLLDVMGPDEYHEHVNDNAYTNFVTKIALEFASFTEESCTTKLNQNWQNIAQNLIIPYDKQYNYHPQYIDYKRTEIVKQADAILLAYPLLMSMNSSTHLNDLQFYEGVTTPKGPAMSWSMFAINYLDLKQLERANKFFRKSYKDYVHTNFKIWMENKDGSGAQNFITGIGGFLQAIINGYAGLRFKRSNDKSIMEIKSTYLPPNADSLEIKGIKFAGSVFKLLIKYEQKTQLHCYEIGEEKLFIITTNNRTPQMIGKDFKIYLNNNETAMISTI